MANLESPKKQIEFLMEKYKRVAAEDRIKRYTEEETKKDFILPLFHALGWHTDDSSEVSAEERISKKRVDYGFRINGIPKFFLEAKSLKEDLSNPEFIAQAINYSWHKGCTWAVLTDFEEVKIFNAEWKTAEPRLTHFKTIPCHELLIRFDELWLLSRESFEKNLLDKEAEKWGKKAKKTPVDQQLLDDFTRFRDILSKNILKLNREKNLTEEDIDESIQRVLDRLIFIRNCEDRGLEQKILISNLREWESRGAGQLIKSLRETFFQFDKLYNSKIFAKHLCDDLQVDNEVLHEIIEGLYFTKDKTISYDFSAIEADVLGNIYEQYLGHILKKKGKGAKLTESHAHRKEQGIYYTPTYIVDYIVRNTLGEILKNKKFDPEKIRVLDPACGSGSFLIKAFDVLNEFYSRRGKDYEQRKLDNAIEGATYSKKLDILKNNIFGVDLDKQAVEIAQLNLLLKIAEKGQRLPLLQQNIKNGNSLIDDSTVAGDKAFKWGVFKQIMEDGGFDVVIGNPPYIRNTELPDNHKEFFSSNYSSAYKQYDILILFFELGIKLLKEGGYLGFITSNKFLASDYGKNLRDIILKNFKIISLIDISNLRIFKDASTYPVITIIQKTSNDKDRKSNRIRFQKISNLEDLRTNDNLSLIQQNKFLDSDNKFVEERGGSKFEIIKKIESGSVRIKDILKCQRGSPKNKIKIIESKSGGALKCIFSRDVLRFLAKVSVNKFVLSSLQDKIISKDKILIPRTVLSLRAAYEEGGNFIMDRIYYLCEKGNKQTNLKFVTGILNSKLIDFYYKVNFGSTHVGGGYLDLRGAQIAELPIKQISDSQQHQLIKIVDKMLSLNKRLSEIGDKKTDERAKMEEDVKENDFEIDELVYKIYGLTEEERAIVENSIK